MILAIKNLLLVNKWFNPNIIYDLQNNSIKDICYISKLIYCGIKYILYKANNLNLKGIIYRIKDKEFNHIKVFYLIIYY